MSVAIAGALVVYGALTMRPPAAAPSLDTGEGTPTLFRTTLTGEPDRRDQLRVGAVRVWSRPSLSGIWCRVTPGVEVSVVAAVDTPREAYQVISDDGRCRGWVDARLTSTGRQAAP